MLRTSEGQAGSLVTTLASRAFGFYVDPLWSPKLVRSAVGQEFLDLGFKRLTCPNHERKQHMGART